RIGGTNDQVANGSKWILKRELPIRVDHIRGVEDPISSTQSYAVGGMPGKYNPGREVLVIRLDQAPRVPILPGEHLLAGREIKTGDPVITLNWPTEIFPAQPNIGRKTVCQLPVVLYVKTHIRIRQVWRKRSGLDCIARGESEKQVGKCIKAGCGRDRHGSAELARERIRSVGL